MNKLFEKVIYGLNLCIKVLESVISIFNFLVGYMMSLIVPMKKTIYLIGSNYGNEADPNATALYSYIKSQGHSVYFASKINKQNYAFTRRGSIHCCYLYICSKAVFYTHSLSDIMPHAHKLSILGIFPTPILIFLQHGVIGLKSRIDEKHTLKSYLLSLEKSFDKMIVSSKDEKCIVVNLGIPADKLCITGLPRFDCLQINSADKKQALVFFTWKNESTHKKLIQEILDSKVVEYLQDNKFKVHFANHHMQAGNSFLSGNTDLTDLVRSCSILITDNSSIAWDFLYRKAHVIFYKAADDWLVYDKTSLVKMRVESNQALADTIKNLLVNDEAATTYTFAEYSDSKNCERVFNLTDSCIKK